MPVHCERKEGEEHENTAVLQVLDQIRNVAPDRYAAQVPEPFRAILRGSFVRETDDRAITMERIAQMLS